MIQLKRAYESAEKSDGTRILVDRLWPRGISKARARIDLWLKDIAPTTALRKWFAHDPAKWKEFQSRYKKELKAPAAVEALRTLRQKSKEGQVTLLYAAKDESHNEAQVLKTILARRGTAG